MILCRRRRMAARATTCDAANDPCPYAVDGECDAGTYCPPNTDCFDCSPCAQFRFEGCEACTANGCLWCGADAACVPDTLTSGAALPPTFSCAVSDFSNTCSADTGNDDIPFSDPLVEATDWVYDLINIQPVWAQGIRGNGIGIRINDNGVDANHPDFDGRFDVASSCSDYLPAGSDWHGTACASLAVAGGDNDVCSVGMAPGATLSSCRIIGGGSSPDALQYRYLYENMENMDISSNSYGLDACYRTDQGQRHLQTSATCPFSQTNPLTPCSADSACAGIDWSGSTSGATLSSACDQEIIRYCQVLYESDVQACNSYLDLFVDCAFNGQTNEEVQAMVQGVTEGRDGKGIIFLFAAGNEFSLGEDVNFEGSLNSRFTIR